MSVVRLLLPSVMEGGDSIICSLNKWYFFYNANNFLPGSNIWYLNKQKNLTHIKKKKKKEKKKKAKKRREESENNHKKIFGIRFPALVNQHKHLGATVGRNRLIFSGYPQSSGELAEKLQRVPEKLRYAQHFLKWAVCFWLCLCNCTSLGESYSFVPNVEIHPKCLASLLPIDCGEGKDISRKYVWKTEQNKQWNM